MMAATESLPFVYSFSGGMPPETLEVFWVGPEGIGEYVTSNSWPYQPPFDEVGHYRVQLTKSEREELARLSDAAGRARAETPEVLESADAGVESFRTVKMGSVVEARWSPTRTPSGYLPLAGSVRRLITRTRHFPVSTLWGRWDEASTPTEQLVLKFTNRGTEPFRLYDFERADEDSRIQVRARYAPARPGGEASSPNPLALLRPEPLKVRNPQDWNPSADGDIILEPGRTLQLEIPRTAPASPQVASQAATLQGLIRLNFWRPGAEGENLLEQGWLIPEPLTLFRNKS